jgi:gliding motility-associated-like protein
MGAMGFRDMNTIQRFRSALLVFGSFWKLPMLVVFLTVGYLELSAQGDINSVSPIKSFYRTGEQITFTGTDIYEDPALISNCDSMVWRNVATQVRYSFRPWNSLTLAGDINYTGTTGVPNSIVNWKISPTLPCGTYFVRINDDEQCNNGVGVLSSLDSVQIEIRDSAIVNYPNPGPFCLNGGPNPAPPTITGDQGTFSDLTGNGILGSTTTGALILHAGTAGLNNIGFTTNGVGPGCSQTVTFAIQVDTLRLQTLNYGGPAFCQGPTVLSVQPPFDPTGGSFSCIPATAALNSLTGAFDLNVAPSGGYAITWTPGPSSCENPHTDLIQLDSLVAADYDYDSIYCIGSSNNQIGTVNFLPPGGYFEQVGGSNLVFLDSLTGQLDLNLTPPALQYIVQYVVTGGCVSLTRDTFEVRTAANAFFNIPNSVCSNEDSLVATGFAPGGTFISLTGDIKFFPPASQGIINVDSCTVGGPFTVIYFVNDPVCPDTVERHVTISPAPTATVNYTDSPYCVKESDPIPFFVSGASGGTFSILPTGTISSSTGIVDLTATGPGQYTINYNVTVSGCNNAFVVDTILILQMPPTNFDLLDTSLCQNSGLHLIQTITSAGSSFSQFTMTNGQFVAFPGAISGNNSVNTDTLPAGGPFRIHRLVDDGVCKDSLVDYVWILPEEDPGFIYAPSEYCQSDRDPSPLITGVGGGIFGEINSTGLVIDDSTGLIDVSASSPGIHTVQYNTGGPCAETATFDVLVTSSTSPDFGYLENTYCETNTDTVSPNLVPDPPAFYHFTVSSAGLVMLDSLTGALDIFASDVGTYNVTLTLDSTSGNCVTEATVSIEILEYENDSIFFPSSVCKTDSFMQILYDTTKSGVFFAPSGLVWEDRATGLVAVYATAVGTYQVTYQITGICAEQFTRTLTVENPADPFFEFPDGDKDFCRSEGSTIAAPTTTGGFFSWFNSSGTRIPALVMDTLTGVVNLSASTSGVYDITYNTGAGCAGDTTVRIIVFPNPASPQIRLEPNDSICLGQSLLITGAGSSFFKIKVNGVIETTQAQLEANNLDSSAIIEVVFITQQLCRDSLDTIVTVLPIPNGIPIVDFPTITGNDEIDFNMTTNVDNTSFNWTLAGVGMVSFDKDEDSILPLLVNDLGNIHVVPTLSNGYEPAQAVFSIVPHAYGCVGDTDIVTIKINPNDLPIFIPEVFTPNDDGKNDRWLIQWNQDVIPSNYKMFIFNRSGGQVEKFEYLRDDWDGGSLPDGVYWWRLYEGNEELFKGAVTIRRR